MKDDIFQKISRFYYRTTAEWNVLICWYVVVLILYKNKNTVANLKNQNGGLIQGGDENILYFSHNKPPFTFCGLATLILFYYRTRTTTYQKMRTFHYSIIKSWNFSKNIIFHIKLFRHFEFISKCFSIKVLFLTQSK
jgi:hypothetical protein